MTAFDWPGVMRAGLLQLRLTPHEFWALTPAELKLMLGLDAQQSPMDRARLTELLGAFPDLMKDVDDD